jgi:hypothetical protein
MPEMVLAAERDARAVYKAATQVLAAAEERVQRQAARLESHRCSLCDALDSSQGAQPGCSHIMHGRTRT